MPNKKPLPQTCGWRFLEIPKIVQTIITVVLGCLTKKVHGKASLLKTIAEGTTYTGHRIWRNQVGTDQEASYLKHSNRVLHSLPGGKAINSFTYL